MNNSQAGFSLVELMVVVVIIGILSTVVVVNVMGSQDEARVSAAYQQMDNFEKALDLYKLDKGSYPETMDALVGKYVRSESIPLDPWNNRYSYVLNEGDTVRPFTIKSYGADGKSGGEDVNKDITNWDVNYKSE